MFLLTPGERRGALTLLVLLLLGTAHDLWLARQPHVGLPTLVSRQDLPHTPPNPSGPSPSPPSASSVAGKPLDLNRASAQELDALPGIGPVLAGRIVAYRDRVGRFRSRDDLLAVPGIGPKLYARLSPLVVAGASSATEIGHVRPRDGNRAERPTP